jgi:hypothetical protein
LTQINQAIFGSKFEERSRYLRNNLWLGFNDNWRLLLHNNWRWRLLYNLRLWLSNNLRRWLLNNLRLRLCRHLRLRPYFLFPQEIVLSGVLFDLLFFE